MPCTVCCKCVCRYWLDVIIKKVLYIYIYIYIYIEREREGAMLIMQCVLTIEQKVQQCPSYIDSTVLIVGRYI